MNLQAIKKTNGFSLLELLIAISLLGIMILLVGTSINLGTKTLGTITYYSNTLNEVRSTQIFLRRSLQKILKFNINGEDTKLSIFEGTVNHMQFLAPLTPFLGGGVKKYILEVKVRNDHKYDLIISFKKIEDNNSWDSTQKLITLNSPIKFSYKGKNEVGQLIGWTNDWLWADHPPDLIRIEADLSTQWPIFIVNLKL